MTKFDPRDRNILRSSLVFVWLVTALVSVIELWGQSSHLLNAAGVHDPSTIKLLVLGGAGIDAILGLLLWFTPGCSTYLSALAMMVVMTLLATIIEPALWLHPLGPLTKNVPLAAILLVLARSRP